MLYRKNVGRAEGLGRALVGAAMVTAGLVWWGAAPLGWVMAASGAGIILSGLFGYCPACAMMGRRPLP